LRTVVVYLSRLKNRLDAFALKGVAAATPQAYRKRFPFFNGSAPVFGPPVIIRIFFRLTRESQT
jgi:hypothetical protein